MAKDAVATMGGILPDDVSGRDAVHVAVFSAVASVPVRPGQRIGIIHQSDTDIEVGLVGDKVAIVDPFLNAPVRPGERFWAYLYPRTITALSHRWTHPALEQTTTAYSTPSAKLRAENWLRGFAGTAELPYDEMMWGAKAHLKNGYYFCDGGKWEGFGFPDEFWDHYEVVTGEKVESDDRGTFFTCSC
jgi:hypothetical protein